MLDGDPQPYIEVIKRNFDGLHHYYAVSALGKIAKKHPAAIDQLIEFLPDEFAIGVLVNLGPLAKKALPKLNELRKQDPESSKLELAAWLISGSPTEAIDKIRQWDSELKENEELNQFSIYRAIENPLGFLPNLAGNEELDKACLLYTSPSPRDQRGSRMPSSA